MILEALDIKKTIRGAQVLKDVNLRLESGTVYGIVGRNGSGKTMLFRALSGLMKVSEGKVLLDGKVLGKDFAVLPGLGMTIENTGMYAEFTGYYNLKLLADIRRTIKRDEIENAMMRVGLEPKDRRVVRKYSMGMKQKLALAQAIMEKPDLLFLDEPTNGLDEDGVERIRNVIMEEKERGALILVASHNREDIERLADQVYSMRGGVLTKEERGEHQYEI